MSLKTNYKNDVFSGKRKYEVIENPDGTVSLDDVTPYSVTGDIFNADDINATNKAVNDTMEEFETVKSENQTFKNSVSQSIRDIETSNQNFQKTVDQAVADMKAARTVLLPTASWGNSVPYTQTVTVNGVSASDIPVIALHIPDGSSADTVKAMKRAFGYLDRAVTGNNSITFYCYEKKPGSQFYVTVKGE